MFNRPLLSHLGASVIALTLAACGGGGGSDSSTPAPQASTKLAITAANYEDVSKSAVSGALFLQDSGGLLGGGSKIRAAAVMQRGTGLARRALSATGLARPAVSVKSSVPCSLGGSLQFDLNDANNDSQLNTGDSLVIEAQNCKEPGSTTNGRLSLAVQTATGTFGSNSYSLSMQMTMTAFTVTDASGTTIGDGSMTLSLTESPNGSADMTLDLVQLSVSESALGKSSTETLANTHLAVHFEASGRGSLTFSGSLKSSAHDNKLVEITTPTPWTLSSTSPYPTAGQLLIRGDAGSQVRVTVLNGTQVKLELDANGDGVFETSVTKAWTELG